MKRFLLPLLVVVALGLLGTLLWFQLGRPNTSSEQGAITNSSTARPATKLDAEAEALSTPDTSGLHQDRANVATTTNAAALVGNIVEGEVRAPVDCMVDTEVEVFALARPSDLDTLMTVIGPRRADGTAAGDLDPKFVVARAKLDQNGRFRLALPKESTKAHLICAGRAWFLHETIAIDVSSGRALVALQAECGGWIEAKVDLPAGATALSALDGEIAQLSMSLTNLTGGPGRFATAFRRNERRASVKDGKFELWALEPDQAYTLDLSTDAFANAAVEVAEVARGQATPVAVRLERGGSVQGAVFDADAKPIVGASVEATQSRGPFGMGERTVRKTTTASDGSYELSAVAPGSVQVSARSRDLPASEPQKVEVTDKARMSGIDFKLGAGETIAGVVRWKDGTPAVGAEVSASGDRGQGALGQFRMQIRGGSDPKFVADKDGRFVVKGLASGSFTLAAEALKPEDAAKLDEKDADARRRSAWRARAPGVKTGTADTTLTLDPPLVVRGVVTSQADGKPVPMFRVQASGGDGGGGRRGGGGGGGGGMAIAFGGAQRQSQDVKNDRGEFTFTFQREGSYKLTISADGFVTSESIDVEVPVKPDAAPLPISLARGAIVQGVVRSPLGTPDSTASGAPVSANAGMFGGRMPGGADDSIKARTDADGRFRLSDLKAGRLVLAAEATAWAKSDELGLDLVAGQTIADAALVMHQGGSIVGESYEDGRPAAGRNITAMEMKSFTSASTRTDAAGRFHLEHLVPGAWRVTAMPPASELASMGQGGRGGGGGDGGMGNMFSKMKSASADVVEGQEVHVVIGAPPEAPVAVHGKVTQGGAPVGGVRVTFMGSGDSFGPGMKTAQSGADGTYSIQLDKPGDYSITIQQNGGRASMLEFVETVKPGAEAVVDLALPTARISGRVRTPEGDPARGIRVSLFPATMGVGGSMMGGFSEITTDDDGNFDVNTLRAGTYTLTVGGSGMGGFRGPGGGGDAKYGRKVVADIQLAESEWRKDMDVRLDNAAGIDVEVVDDHGAVVMGASIFARDEAGRVVDRMSTVRTDANGKARYGGLSPGAYTFSARKDSLSSGESTKVDVRSTASSPVKITIGQGTLLYVTTVDANGEPLRARVSVTDEAGHDVAGLMSAQDLMERMTRGGPGGNEQKIGPLAPAKYKVKAVATNGKTVEKTVTLTGQAERKMTIAFSD